MTQVAVLPESLLEIKSREKEVSFFQAGDKNYIDT